MKLILLNSTIVLVTKDQIPPVDHNFLVHQHIITSDFQLHPQSINAPALSLLNYKNHFNFTIEPHRVQISFSKPIMEQQDYLSDLKTLEDTTSQWIEVFKYIQYQSIGINFDWIADDLKYNSTIKQVIPQDTPRLSFKNNKGEVVNASLSYKLNGKNFNVNIGKIEKRGGKGNKVLGYMSQFIVNVDYPNVENKTTIIKELKANYEDSKKFIGGFYESKSSEF